jgi:ribulose-bisphosphate carboxylase large chain
VQSVIEVVYHVRCRARAVDDRARAIAIEQSVEMPVSAITDDYVCNEIVGQVAGIRELSRGLFEVRIHLAGATAGSDPGQLINMLFGNTSLHAEVALHDAELPGELVTAFGGPRHGLAGLRRRVGAPGRALTCSALKPQGLPAGKLAELARGFAQGGIDYVKDDHGLADQTYSPFTARAAAVTAALRGTATRYVPSLSGDLDAVRRQIAAAHACGIDTVMAAPMILGLSNFHRLSRDHPDIAFIAHPTLAGAAIAPPLLFGKLFRMLGADAVIFPNHGGRFGYSAQTCRELAATALRDWHGLAPCVPVPAGGMSRDRVGEMLDFYGPDIMLLIGGALLEAGAELEAATAAFVAEVHRYRQGADRQVPHGQGPHHD